MNDVIISESIREDNFETISEGSGANKKWFLNGVFGGAEKINKNRRYYPGKVMGESIGAYQPLIENRGSLGELNHPQSLTVNPERACINVTELKFENNEMMGKSKVLESLPMGKIIAALLNEDIKLGVSTRAGGKITKNINFLGETGITRVDKMSLIAIDVVHNPSYDTAFPKAEWLGESCDWCVDIGMLTSEDAEILAKVREKASSVVTNKVLSESFAKMLSGGVSEYLQNVIKRQLR